MNSVTFLTCLKCAVELLNVHKTKGKDASEIHALNERECLLWIIIKISFPVNKDLIVIDRKCSANVVRFHKGENDQCRIKMPQFIKFHLYVCVYVRERELI